MRIIELDDYENELTKLERLNYEVYSRESIISLLIKNNNIDSPAYKKYCDEFTDYFMQYEKAKDEFSSKFLTEEEKSDDSLYWNIDFKTKQMVVK